MTAVASSGPDVDAFAVRAGQAVDPLRRAYLLSCLDELQAPKPGNVSVYSAGHGMTAGQFLRSAEASAGPLCRPSSRVGARVLEATEASWATAGCNTNLGIVLLCAPLIKAAQHLGTAGTQITAGKLQDAVCGVLAGLDLRDTEQVFEAIRLAAPGGLGQAPQHDVHARAQAPLRQVMAEAAGRDRVARQYACDFADVFGLGLPALQLAEATFGARKWQVVALYLALLAWVPDTHVQRKFGIEAALSVRDEARAVREVLLHKGASPETLAVLRDFDARLKSGGINPGTTADLTVATLLAHRLGG